MPLSLPNLPYAFDALEPHIDAQTMQIHHGKHHAAYVTNCNKALEGTAFAERDADWLITHLSDLPEDKRGPVRNNAGGHINHAMFWKGLAPADKGGGGAPTGALAEAITKAFGSFDAFKEKFAAAGVGRFGSGWAWLCVGGDKSLAICSTANQDTPVMGKAVAGCEGAPILGVDVWEHAYYLKYQNRRADYLAAFWNVVNWARAGELYGAALAGGAWYEVKQATNGKFMFNLKSGNGEVVLTSETYNDRAGAMNGISSVRTNAGTDARFERKTGSNGQPFFVLKAGNSEPIGRSEMYSSPAAMENGIAAVKRCAGAMLVEDVTG
jgi:Fe-Mn family superoxide dismutase